MKNALLPHYEEMNYIGYASCTTRLSISAKVSKFTSILCATYHKEQRTLLGKTRSIKTLTDYYLKYKGYGCTKCLVIVTMAVRHIRGLGLTTMLIVFLNFHWAHVLSTVEQRQLCSSNYEQGTSKQLIILDMRATLEQIAIYSDHGGSTKQCEWVDPVVECVKVVNAEVTRASLQSPKYCTKDFRRIRQ